MSLRPLHRVVFMVLVALWGSCYLMVGIALAAWTAAEVTALRVTTAALVLVAAVIAGRRRWPRDLRTWLYLGVIAIVGNCLPFFLISWGQQEVESGLAGILAGTTPLVVLVLAHFTLDDERLTPRQALAFLLGFAGIVMLMGPDSLAAFGGRSGRLIHEFAVLGGAVCYAFATVAARLMPRHDPVVISAAVMLLASGIMAPYAVDAVSIPDNLPRGVLAAIGFLGLLGTGLASILYFYLIAETGARFTSYLNYLVPVWAVALGAIVLGEKMSLNSMLALALILAGLFFGHGRSVPDPDSAGLHR